MNSLILVSLILSVLLGIFRGIDLTFWTDAETGLCVVGPVWLRYVALAAVVGIAVAAGRSSQPKPDALRGRCIPSGVAALAAAVCYGETAVLRILWMHSSVVMLLRAVLEALCAFWMLGLGLSWLRKDWKAPTRSLTPAVLGSAVFYWCVLARFGMLAQGHTGALAPLDALAGCFTLPFGSFFHFSQRNFSILSNFYFFSLITY